MEFLSVFQGEPETMAILSIVFLTLIFWVRRPERMNAGNEDHAAAA